MKMDKFVRFSVMVAVIAIVFGVAASSSYGQETSTTDVTNAPCGSVSNYIAFWNPSPTLCNSVIWQTTAGLRNGYIGINQTNPSTRLDVKGAINASPDPNKKQTNSGNYQILESPVLSIGWPANEVVVANANVYVGVLAGAQGFVQGVGNGDTGVADTFVGDNAAFHNQAGSENTAVGAGASYRNTTGNYNTSVGVDSAFGVLGATTGSDNTLVGGQSGFGITTGGSNTIVGFESGYSITSGQFNTFLGQQACYNIMAGNTNICIGSNVGPASDASNTIWIGAEGVHTAAYIAGIYGEPVGSTNSEVCIDNTGLLGTVGCPTSSSAHLVAAQQEVITHQQVQIETLQRQIEEFQQRLSRVESLIAKK
jgi:hypothetical protein